MSTDYTEEDKDYVRTESLEAVRERILVEMTESPLLSRETCDFLIQTYTDKLAEIYY